MRVAAKLSPFLLQRYVNMRALTFTVPKEWRTDKTESIFKGILQLIRKTAYKTKTCQNGIDDQWKTWKSQ